MFRRFVALFCFDFRWGWEWGRGVPFTMHVHAVKRNPLVKFNRITKICKIHVHIRWNLAYIFFWQELPIPKSTPKDLTSLTLILIHEIYFLILKILLSNIPRGTRGTILYECSPVTCYYVKKKLLQKLIRNCILIYVI